MIVDPDIFCVTKCFLTFLYAISHLSELKINDLLNTNDKGSSNEEKKHQTLGQH